MKFNRRFKKSGRSCGAVAVRHFLGSVEIAQILADWPDMAPDLWGLTDGHAGGKPTLTATEDRIRARIWLDGNGAYNDNWPAEDDRADHVLTIATWAVEQVRRLYPELDDDALAAWLADFAKEAETVKRMRAAWIEKTGEEMGFEEAYASGHLDEAPPPSPAPVAKEPQMLSAVGDRVHVEGEYNCDGRVEVVDTTYWPPTYTVLLDTGRDVRVPATDVRKLP